MPELPEVQALVDFLAERAVGQAVVAVELGSISVLKTYDPPPSALAGGPIDGVHRHGKFLDVDVDGIHLVFHLARAGWLRWSEAIPATVIRPGKSPIALRVRLSDGSGFDRGAVHRAIEQYIGATAKVSLLDIMGVPPWVPRPNRLFTGNAMRATKRLADRAIETRRAEGAKAPPDLLDLLMAGSDPETGRQMTTAELRDNLLTFIVAGHETTALTLSWALYLCAFDPAVQAAAQGEASAVLGNRAAAVADLPRLPLVRRIVDEALRMYPPAAFLSRTAMATDQLCGREVKPGDTVILPIYALHRHRLLWDDPDAFRPDRFADPKAVPRFQYLPFGDGPRICIGASFALQEAVIILATLLARFRFSPVPGREPKPVMILTLRPEGGVWLKVERA